MQTKIKVLEIIKGLDIGGTNGGAEQFAIQLAKSLDRNQYQVMVCAFFKQGTATEAYWHKELTSQGIEVFFVSEWHGNNRFDTYLRGMFALKETLKENHVDVCHSHFQLGTITAIYLKMLGVSKRAIRTVHILQEWEKSWYGYVRRQVFTKWIFPACLDAEVGVSQALVNELSQHPGTRLFKKKPILIYNAIPIRPFSLTHAKQERKTRILGTVGRLEEQKGHRFLLGAIPEIIAEIQDVMFWFIGDGSLRQELETLARDLGISKHINFMGKRTDVADLVAQLDLFILPSLWEGFPTVIMESMASGIPVLATRIPGTDELIEDGLTGWLVDPGSSEALANGIIQVLKNPEEWDGIKERALKGVSRFSIENISAHYHSLFQKLLVGRG